MFDNIVKGKFSLIVLKKWVTKSDVYDMDF